MPTINRLFGEDEGESFLRSMLRQIQGVRAGTTPITELPEYKYMASDITQNYQKLLPELHRYMTSQNISGGAASELLRKMQEQTISGTLGAQRQAWEGTVGQGTDIASFLENLNQQEKDRLLQAYMGRKGIQTQRDIARMQGVTQGSMLGIRELSSGIRSGVSGGAAGGGCCFIFIEGDRLTDNVRNARDTFFPKGCTVENGYRKMAKWLVPIMHRNWFIREIVRFIMLNPICNIADHYYGYNSWGWIFSPIGHFWKKVWERMGR